MRYSKTIITHLVKGIDGKERLYRAQKMSSLKLASEGFKLLKAISPSIGAGLDNMRSEDDVDYDLFGERATTWTAAFQLLENNLSVEHFEDLTDKLLGGLIDGDGKPLPEDYFDEHQGDYLEVLFWLLKENFANFILESGMFRSKIQNVQKMVEENPKLKGLIESVLTS